MVNPWLSDADREKIVICSDDHEAVLREHLESRPGRMYQRILGGGFDSLSARPWTVSLPSKRGAHRYFLSGVSHTLPVLISLAYLFAIPTLFSDTVL